MRHCDECSHFTFREPLCDHGKTPRFHAPKDWWDLKAGHWGHKPPNKCDGYDAPKDTETHRPRDPAARKCSHCDMPIADIGW